MNRGMFGRIGAVVVIAGLALLYVWQHAQLDVWAYEKDALQNQRDELRQKNRLLQVELAELKSPERIERIAREQLRMVPPDKVEIIPAERRP